MTYSIVYSSQTGNTRMLAEAIKETLAEKDIVYFGEPCQEALKADFIFAGFWTDKGFCCEETGEFLKKLDSNKLFLFGTAGFGISEDYFSKIIERTKELVPQSAELKGSFMCQGKMPLSVRERYVNMKNSGAPIPNIDKMIENFDSALSHPDEADLNSLREKIKAL